MPAQRANPVIQIVNGDEEDIRPRGRVRGRREQDSAN